MKATVIIPAFNEEKTIKGVIMPLKDVDFIKEIIVVSDGSWDRTAAVAKECGVMVVELKENIGKGGAMKEGLKYCSGEVILFLDADLIGLTKNHVVQLMKPVLEKKADMSVGIFTNGRAITDLAHRIAPFLSGQRCVTSCIINNLCDVDISRFGVETALTRFVNKKDINVQEVFLENLTHIMKEEKMGLVKGFAARIKMYWEIVKSLRSAR